MSEFHPILPDQILHRGRRLRRTSTGPERRLWNELRSDRLCGLRFRRQHAVGPFVVDFYCHEHRLAIELDGDSHIDRAVYDRQREEFLKAERLRVLRFANDDVLRDLDVVLRAILAACKIDPLTGSPVSIDDTPSP